MKQIFLFLFLAVEFSANSQGTNFTPLFSAGLDTKSGKLLLTQCSRVTPKNVSEFWTISRTNIKDLESSFGKIYSLISRECCSPGRKVDSLKNFGFQYVGVIINGKKFIYINAFPFAEVELIKKYKANFDPTKAPVKVCDGGPHFWGSLFDIETKMFSALNFNGTA